METSEVTGFPELPEGHFWRVKSVYGYGGLFNGLRLQIIRRKKGWFRVTENVLQEVDYSIDGTPERVRKGLLRHAETLHGWFVRTTEVLELVGDYPPKKIDN